MKFDKSRVYTALNADDVKPGSRVIVADDLAALKEKVEKNTEQYPFDEVNLDEVNPDSNPYRFAIAGISYMLCYLVSKWEEKDKEIIYYCFLHKDRYTIQFMFDYEMPSSHIYAEFSSRKDAYNWCKTHDKFAEIAKAYEDGKTIQFYSLAWDGKWIDCEYHDPSWDLNTKYRIKPDEPVEVETSEGKMYLANGAEIPKKRRMTNKELAYWLSTGKGQLRLRSGDISTYIIYTKDNSYVPKNYKIRGWDETEWHEPEVEVSV